MRRAKVSATNFSRHIREVDAIVQVVRCFEDADIHHVAGSVDPVRDIETITTELVLADLEAVQEAPATTSPRTPSAATRKRSREEAVLKKLEPHLNAGKPALTARTHAGGKGRFAACSG